MDDPRGEYMFGLEDRVAKLDREVEESSDPVPDNAGWVAG